MSILFTPITVGDFKLANRIIMAPLTRTRANQTRVPNEMMAQYYADRASAGLIISEATSICPTGVGYANTPGIWSDEQIDGWKLVTTAVHQAGGKIFLQLWHVGRVSDPMFLNGELPIAPSSVALTGHISLVRPPKQYVVPRALDTEEISEIVWTYRKAAENAKKAGFDGVEIHAGNGYLLDQFLQDSTNLRSDRYGGNIENRAKLILEVVDEVIPVWGKGRVGVHIAPRCDMHGMGDSNPLATFSYLVKELSKRRIAFIFSRESQGDNYIGEHLKQIFDGIYIANEKLTREDAESLLIMNKADAVSFGIPFLANPDLPKRLLLRAPLNTPDPTTFYGSDLKGYNDYPTLNG